MIRFSCPGCGAAYTVGDEKAGKTGRCPKCQTQFLIPEPEPGPPQPPAPPPGPGDTVEVRPCPGCGAKLAVEPADLGLDVECPYCKTVYKAVRAGSAPPAPPRPSEREDTSPLGLRDDEEERPSRRRRRREDEDDYDDRPSRRRRSRYEDDDDDDDDYEDDYRPRRRRRRRRDTTEEAERMVAAPSIILVVIGILGILYGILNIFVYLTGFGGPPPGGAPKNGPEKAGQAVGAFLPIIWGGVVTAGGFKMKSLSGRGMAITGAVFAMLPCSPCCLLGLPIGIWALVVLNNPDVKDAFT